MWNTGSSSTLLLLLLLLLLSLMLLEGETDLRRHPELVLHAAEAPIMGFMPSKCC